MGNLSSKERPPDIDLLPPKFERKAGTLDKLSVSPLEYMFGTETRHRLFTDYFAPSNLITFTASLRPDFSEQTVVSLRSDISPFSMDNLRSSTTATSTNRRSTVSSIPIPTPSPSASPNQFAFGLGYTAEDHNTTVAGNLHLGNDGTLRSLVSCYLNDYNIGMYTLLPGEYFLHRKYYRHPNNNSSSSSSNPLLPVQQSIFLPSNLGTPILTSPTSHHHQRYTQTPVLTASSSTTTTTFPIATDPSNSTNTPNPETRLPSIRIPSDSLPLTETASSSSSSSSSASSATVACPEIGVRFIDPLQRFSIGTHIGLPFPSTTGSSSSLLSSLSSTAFPFKFWMVGGYTKQETVNYGIQLASDTLRLLNNTSSNDPGSLSSSIDNPRRFDLDAAISIGQSPIYEISLALDGYRKEIVAGYTHALTIRRRVYNIFERSNVKGIYQYLTLGIEARKQLELPFTTSLAFASSLQFNRSTLAKIRVGQRDISTTLALKTWTDPAVTLCVTGSYDRYYNTNSGIGLHLNIERGGTLDYRKAITGYQTVAENKALIAQDQLSSRITEHIDKKPFDTPESLGIVPKPRLIVDSKSRFL